MKYLRKSLDQRKKIFPINHKSHKEKILLMVIFGKTRKAKYEKHSSGH